MAQEFKQEVLSMTGIDYLRQYDQDLGNKYEHLPTLAIAEKVSKILARRFMPTEISQATLEALADKFDVTDASMHKLVKILNEKNVFRVITQ